MAPYRAVKCRGETSNDDADDGGDDAGDDEDDDVTQPTNPQPTTFWEIGGYGGFIWTCLGANIWMRCA